MNGAIVTTVPAIWKGSIFACGSQLFKATKCNPANIRCIGMDGRTYNVRWEAARDATPDEVSRYKEWEESQKDPEADPLADLHRLGNVVRFKNPTKPAMQGLFVVTKSKADGYSLVTLGGNLQSRYFPTVPGSHLEKVEGEIHVTNV